MKLSSLGAISREIRGFGEKKKWIGVDILWDEIGPRREKRKEKE